MQKMRLNIRLNMIQSKFEQNKSAKTLQEQKSIN